MSQSIRERIRTCDTLPTLPAAALRVLQLTNDNTTSTEELGQIIARDPALSVKVLRAVNSPFYGIPQKISSVQQAVVMLGLHSVKMLVLGFSLTSCMRNGHRGGFSHLAFWKRSMYSAAAARVVCGHVLPSRQEECFIASLLMDIGTLVLDQLLGEQYTEVYERASSHSELSIVETHALGITHAEVAGMLAEHWRLPEELGVPMANHHTPMGVENVLLKKMTQVVWLAGRCADIFVHEKTTAESITAVRATCRELYKYDEVKSDALLCSIGQKTAELAALFDVKVNTVGYEQIVAAATERLLEMSIANQGGPEEKRNERRGAARMRRDGKLVMIPCARGVLGTPVTVRLKDISATGIGFVHTAPLEAGSQFVVQLRDPGAAARQNKSLLYNVVRSEKVGDLYTIGAQLATVLRPDGGKPAKPEGEAAAAAAATPTPTAVAAK
jgi:HD-like signal output (HDOD) protein